MDPAQPFNVVETSPGVLSLVGELDIMGLPEVRGRLVDWRGDITFDCSGLTFIDSSGLGMLVDIHKTCDGRGVKLVLIEPAPCLTRVLELTGLDGLFNVMLSESDP